MLREERAPVLMGLTRLPSAGWCLSALLLIQQVASQGRAEEDWPQFRGPRGDGTATAAELPLVWSETNNLAWKAALPGLGRSSPVVLGGHIWVTTALARGERRTRIGPDDMRTAEHVTLEAMCLSGADGKAVWETAIFEVDQPAPAHWLNSWATPTPVVEPGYLYCDFGTYGTAAIDAKTGNILWQRHLPLDHQVGPGSSPVLWQNLLLLVRDGRDAQYVTALEKETGRTVWKTDRPPIDTPTTDLRKSFSTPLLVGGDGRTQMIAAGPHWIVSYDPATGREIWRVRHGQGFSFGSCPAFGHGLVFFSTGCFEAQLWAVSVGGEGDVTSTRVAWKCQGQIPVMSSPVLGGDELYWVSDDGIACCVECAVRREALARTIGRHLSGLAPLCGRPRVLLWTGRQGHRCQSRQEVRAPGGKLPHRAAGSDTRAC